MHSGRSPHDGGQRRRRRVTSYHFALGLAVPSRHGLRGVASHHFALALLRRSRHGLHRVASHHFAATIPSHHFAATIVVVAMDSGDMRASIFFSLLKLRLVAAGAPACVAAWLLLSDSPSSIPFERCTVCALNIIWVFLLSSWNCVCALSFRRSVSLLFLRHLLSLLPHRRLVISPIPFLTVPPRLASLAIPPPLDFCIHIR